MIGLKGSAATYRKAVEGWGRGPEGWDFGVVSSMATDSQDRVYIIDRVLVVHRTNERIQIFDAEGNFQDQWTQFIAANDLYIDQDDVAYLSEAPRRISILDLEGEAITPWGKEG